MKKKNKGAFKLKGDKWKQEGIRNQGLIGEQYYNDNFWTLSFSAVLTDKNSKNCTFQ